MLKLRQRSLTESHDTLYLILIAGVGEHVYRKRLKLRRCIYTDLVRDLEVCGNGPIEKAIGVCTGVYRGL